ncbi:hypothetical protein [Bradyrhizobium neotropicale]|uniref:hypothetical protein n=1 Tax=Bradyrhizobium neotropicale TaxID=1497615 RepID=UPI001AD6D793|nr:hypothetical protein [Bradyrhizobium neotropicale]MBO4221257.1 hypothetical protein [Bradyrhizobium neotropicale]
MALYSAANLAAFSGACPFFVALLRGGANPNKSAPGPAETQFPEQGFLLSKMKEYDA